jgi:hypothetical protein
MFTCLHCDNLLIKKSKLNICLLWPQQKWSCN